MAWPTQRAGLQPQRLTRQRLAPFIAHPARAGGQIQPESATVLVPCYRSALRGLERSLALVQLARLRQRFAGDQLLGGGQP